jgi:hypothetical protein
MIDRPYGPKVSIGGLLQTRERTLSQLDLRAGGAA